MHYPYKVVKLDILYYAADLLLIKLYFLLPFKHF